MTISFFDFAQQTSTREITSTYPIRVTSGNSYSITEVPNPKNVSQDNYVSNPDNILLDYEVEDLNTICKKIDDSSELKTAVVVLFDIDKEDFNSFATELYNHWGIGSRDKNHGVLILHIHAMGRTVMRTGNGTELVLTDSEVFNILVNTCKPQLLANQYGKAFYNTLVDVDAKIQSKDDLSIMDNSTNTNTETNYTYTGNTETYAQQNYTPAWVSALMAYGIVAGIVTIVFLIMYFFYAAPSKLNYHKYHRIRLFSLLVWPILFPIPFLLIYFFVMKKMKFWREDTLYGSISGMPLRRLGEFEDDDYLKSGQITEEHIGSIDYDVWIGEHPDDILVLDYKKWFTKYKPCPKCANKTYHYVSNVVLERATTTSTGRGLKTHKCEHCRFVDEQYYTIAKIQKSSSSSYSGGGSSWSSGGSSSGGSSGGSWGGGSSGGGGSYI